MNMFSNSEDIEDARHWMGSSTGRENHCLKLAILLISLIIMTAAPGIVLLIIEEAKLTSKIQSLIYSRAHYSDNFVLETRAE